MTGYTYGELGYFNNPGPNATTTKKYDIDTRTPTWRGAAASAISTTNPDWVYYIPREDGTLSNNSNIVYGGLYAYNSSTGTVRQLSQYSLATRSNRLGVAPDGSVWTVTLNGRLYQFVPNSATDPTGGTWYDRGTVTSPSGANFDTRTTDGLASGDLAFDGVGNMWLIGSDRVDQTAWLFTIPWSDLTDGGGASAHRVGSMGTGEFNGIAFTGDGRLWATSITRGATSRTGTLHLVNMTDGSTTAQKTFTDKRFEDLGSCALPTPELRVTKEVEPTGTVRTGDTLTYTIRIENIGNVPATGVTMQDTLPSGVTYVRRSTQRADLDYWDRPTWTTVNDTWGSPYFPFNTANLVRSPGIPARLDGMIAPQDAAVIRWQVTVDPGQTRVCNQGNVVYVGGPQGGIKTDDPTLPGHDDTTCTDIVNPAIQLDKWSETTTLTENPEVVVWHFDITNIGDEPLRDITLTDDKCEPQPQLVEGPDGVQYNVGDLNQNGWLDPATTNPVADAEVWKYTCTLTLTEADLDANGNHVNVAVTTGIGVYSEEEVTDTDNWTIDSPTPAIDLVKTGDKTAVGELPTTVVYTYVVTPAASEEALYDVKVTDDKCAPDGGTPGVTPLTYVSGDTNEDGILDLDETWTFTCTKTLTADDFTAGSHINTATTEGWGVVSKKRVTDEDTWRVTPPNITLEKTSTDLEGNPFTEENPLTVGETIVYSMVVTNTGTNPLTKVTLTDEVPDGTTYVEGTATKTYPKDISGNQTVTETTSTRANGSSMNTSWTQTIPAPTGLPAGAKITGYSVSMSGTTNSERKCTSWFIVCTGYTTYYGEQTDLSVEAQFGDNTVFEVNRGADAGSNAFGTERSGSWTLTRSGTTAPTDPGPLTLTWHDANNHNEVNPDQTINQTTVTWTYEYTVTETERRYVTEAADPPPELVTTADNITLNPGETLTVTFHVIVNEGAPDTIVNTATADSEETPPVEDDTEDPVEKDTDFAVQKAAEGGEPGGTGTAVEPVWDGDTESYVVTATYTVTVTNTGDKAAPHPEIGDHVSLPPGFSIERVTLDGVAVQGQDGAFTIPAGTASLEPGGTASYEVVVTGRTAPDGGWATVDWEKAGNCVTEGAGDPEAGGFFNLVAMDPDSDGSENNDACVPVEPPTFEVIVEKLGGDNCDVGRDACPVEGAEFAVYDSDPSVAGGNVVGSMIVDPENFWEYTLTDLEAGEYWLVETKAPAGHDLLAEPIHFSLAPTGITLLGGDSDLIYLKEGSVFVIVVTDVSTGELPMSGGNGSLPYWIGALVLAAAGLITQRFVGAPAESRARRAA